MAYRHGLYLFTFLCSGRVSILLLLVDAAYIAAVRSLNGDSLALVDEQRNADLSAGLQCCRLGGVGSSVALYARLAVSDLQVCLVGHLG